MRKAAECIQLKYILILQFAKDFATSFKHSFSKNYSQQEGEIPTDVILNITCDVARAHVESGDVNCWNTKQLLLLQNTKEKNVVQSNEQRSEITKRKQI